MRKFTSLEDLYVDALREMYSTEQQIIKALPKIKKECTHDDLCNTLDHHLDEENEHLQRLEDIFSRMGKPAKAKRSTAVDSLITDTKDMINEDMDDNVRDAAIIANVQKLEHFEIAGYGCCVVWAERLGYDDHSRDLREILNQEKQADKDLTRIAEEHINQEAVTPEDTMNEGGSHRSGRSMGNGRSASSRSASSRRGSRR